MFFWFYFFFDRHVLFIQNLGKRKRLVVRQEKLKCSKSKVVIFNKNFKHSYSDWKFQIQSLTDFTLQIETQGFLTNQRQIR